MKFNFNFVWMAFGAGLIACSSVSTIYVQTKQVEIASSRNQFSSSLDSIIAPYRDSLRIEMGKIIGYASGNFERNRPEGTLGNFMADVVLESSLKAGFIHIDEKPICILNHGGLRAPINKGNVCVGDIYKLMPFDNNITVVKIPIDRLKEIYQYMELSGGEPISGFKIKDNEIQLATLEELTIVTTNYLASGGDNMNFLKDPISRVDFPILLREVLIDYIGSADTIVPYLDERIKFN